jgi:hypothetical protein
LTIQIKYFILNKIITPKEKNDNCLSDSTSQEKVREIDANKGEEENEKK